MELPITDVQLHSMPKFSIIGKDAFVGFQQRRASLQTGHFTANKQTFKALSPVPLRLFRHKTHNINRPLSKYLRFYEGFLCGPQSSQESYLLGQYTLLWLYSVVGLHLCSGEYMVNIIVRVPRAQEYVLQNIKAQTTFW